MFGRSLRNRRAGLTLIELMLAVTLLGVVAAVTFFSFDAGTKAWRAGTELADSLHHADYVLEQLVMGLRSAYYPDANRPTGRYGFTLVNDGEGAEAHDRLSWVKLGTALVGADAPFAGTPHRVEVTSRSAAEAEGDDEDPGFGFAVRAWRIDAQAEEFDPAVDATVFYLSPRVVGLNCRVLDPEKNLKMGNDPDAEEEQEWLDDWEGDYTNRLPFAVEIALYLAPTEARGEPIEVKRVVELPTAPLSWRDKGGAGGAGAATTGDSRTGAGGATSGGSDAEARRRAMLERINRDRGVRNGGGGGTVDRLPPPRDTP